MKSRSVYFLRAAFVIGVALVVAIVTTMATRDSKTSYDMSVRVLVDQPQSIGEPAGITNVSKLQQLIPTYAQIVMINTTAQKVSTMLPDVSAPEALAAISAGAMEKTQILTVGAQTDDPDKAKTVAYAAANPLI